MQSLRRCRADENWFCQQNDILKPTAAPWNGNMFNIKTSNITLLKTKKANKLFSTEDFDKMDTG